MPVTDPRLVHSLNSPQSNANQWILYTPVVTAGTGSITAYTATGRYNYLTDKTIMVDMQINISNNGTGGQYVLATLPFKWSVPSYWTTGIPTTFQGTRLVAGAYSNIFGTFLVGAANAQVAIMNAAGAYPAVNNVQLNLCGQYGID